MGVSGAEELETAYSFLCCPIIQECSVKENPDRKKNIYERIPSLQICEHNWINRENDFVENRFLRELQWIFKEGIGNRL